MPRHDGAGGDRLERPIPNREVEDIQRSCGRQWRRPIHHAGLFRDTPGDCYYQRRSTPSFDEAHDSPSSFSRWYDEEAISSPDSRYWSEDSGGGVGGGGGGFAGERRDQPLPSQTQPPQPLPGYEDIFVSSCEEVEIDEIYACTQRQQREWDDDEDPLSSPSSSTTPRQLPLSSNTMLQSASDSGRELIRAQLHAHVNQVVRRWKPSVFSSVADPYPCKHCFGCTWEDEPTSQNTPRLFSYFFEYLQKNVGSMMNLERLCQTAHEIFMRVIYPNLARKRVWRSWHIRHHLLHHTSNAHVMHYKQMMFASSHVAHSYDALYGENSEYCKTGKYNPRIASTFVQASNNLFRIYATKPDTFSYNSSEVAYDVSKGGGHLVDASRKVLSLLEEEGRKVARDSLSLSAPQPESVADEDELVDG